MTSNIRPAIQSDCPGLKHLEDRLIDAEIHRRDCDHDFEVARDAWLKAVLAASLATDALERATWGAHD